MSSSRAKEVELNEDESRRKSKSLHLLFRLNGRSPRQMLYKEEANPNDEDFYDQYNNSDDSEFSFLSRRVQHLWHKRKE